MNNLYLQEVKSRTPMGHTIQTLVRTVPIFSFTTYLKSSLIVTSPKHSNLLVPLSLLRCSLTSRLILANVLVSWHKLLFNSIIYVAKYSVDKWFSFQDLYLTQLMKVHTLLFKQWTGFKLELSGSRFSWKGQKMHLNHTR